MSKHTKRNGFGRRETDKLSALLVDRIIELEKKVFGDSDGTELRSLLASIEALEKEAEPTIVCAWCDTTLSAGGEVVSHGICATCEAKIDAEMDAELPKHEPRSVLKNGCTIFTEAPHKRDKNATVVVASERGPLGIVCWCVDREGNAYWGSYGRTNAVAAYNDRTGLNLTDAQLEILMHANAEA